MEDLLGQYQETARLLREKIAQNRRRLTQVRGKQYLELMRRTNGLRDMLQDVEYALVGLGRSMRRNPSPSTGTGKAEEGK